MKKIITIIIVSLISAQPETPADSLLQSNKTSIFQKAFIFPIVQWQKISYKSEAFNCQFYPSCSNYCSLAIKEYGSLYGTIIGLDRITRCNPSALYYHQKINGSYKDEDGRLIDYVSPTFYHKGKKSTVLSTVLAIIPGMGKIYSGRVYDGMYGALNFFASLKAYSFAKENQNKIMMNVFGTTSLIFYISDIYGSWRAAKYYQPKKIKSHKNKPKGS